MQFRVTASIAATAICTLWANGALAGPIYENTSGGTFTFYGQFNPAFLSFDDGQETNDELVDNASSNTRVGMWIRQPFGENQFRFRFETGLGLRASDAVSQTFTPDAINWDRTDLRHVDFQYETPSYGTFYLGQGSMASDGIGDRSLAGTGLAGAVAIGDIAGSYELRTSAGDLSGITIRNAFTSLDGARRGRIRYDTPTFNGFTFSIAYGQDILTSGNDDDFYDIAVGYKNELSNGVEIEAGLGYQVRDVDGGEDVKDTFGSFTFLLPSGFNGTVSVGDRDTGGDYYYVKVGLRRNFFAIGETAFAIDYYSGDDFVSEGGEAKAFGIGFTQDFDNANIEAYFGYRDYSYDDTSGTVFQDADSYILGARWSF